VVSAGDSKWSVLKGSTIMATWTKRGPTNP
jgi:hypothetical protein